MNTATIQNSRKKTVLVTALVACLVLAIGGGVLAWFSANDSVTNTFVNKEGITDPEKDPSTTDPTKPDQNSKNDPDGNITETEWDDKSPLTPGSITPKNPNMGIGKDSQPAYVFAMVENNLPADAYFVLGKGWQAVDGYCTKYTGDKNPAIPTTGVGDTYTKGLFVYVGDNNPIGGVIPWKMLAPTTDTDSQSVGAYTGELFDKVYTSDTFAWDTTSKEGNIKVSAYFAAASGDKEYANESKEQLTDEAKNEILTNVKKWASAVKVTS